MNRYDRNKNQKSSRFPTTLLLILIGGSWIYNLYDDVSWIKSEKLILENIIEKKDEQILALIKIVDSLTYKPKTIIIHDEPKKVQFVKKNDTIKAKISIKDSLKLVEKLSQDTTKK